MRVGDHGGDHIGNTVWAILDHNSDFAVVPEPSTYALIGGIICLNYVIIRKTKLIIFYLSLKPSFKVGLFFMPITASFIKIYYYLLIKIGLPNLQFRYSL